MILQVQNIKKSFGKTQVLNGVSIDIQRGEFITFLGPSGCGKTTTLRIIAGLEEPDSGCVILDGKDVTELEPNKRDVNTVFQNYALFPHMNVEQNVGYSLKLKRKSKEEIHRTVQEMLAQVQLSGYEKRMPSELSGGQKQRVAIARALANQPRVLLLDEPLGALDLQLRRQMQLELKHLQKRIGLTFLYITHDQEEALNMSDRIVVMRDGRFEQIGTPADVYERPRTSFVARFVGSANILRGTARQGENGTMLLDIANGTVGFAQPEHPVVPGDALTIAVRSEQIRFGEREGELGIAAVVREKSFAGGMLRIAFTLDDGSEVVASRHGIDLDVRVGDKTFLNWDASAAKVVEDDEG